MRRLAAALVALAACVLPAAGATASPAASTVVEHAAPAGAHGVRVTVKAAGDLDASQVDARLGGRIALVEGVHRVGPARPLHLIFALDTSGSMAGVPITAAIGAGQRLLDAVGQGDKVGLVVFDDSARVVAPLSSNVSAVRNALGTVSTAQGTSLYDGVLTAAGLTGRNPDAQRVVVLLSDGADTSSHATLPKVLKHLSGSGIEVDVVGLTASGSFTDAPLREIAAATGGTYVSTASTGGLEPLAVRLAQQRLSTDYAVDITLPHSDARTLQVSVKGATPARVDLPAGVSAPSYGIWHSYGAWIVMLIGASAVLVSSFLLLTWASDRPRTLASRLSPYSADLKVQGKERVALMLDLYDDLEERFGNGWAWKRIDRLNERAGATAPTGRTFLAIGVCGLLPACALLVAIGLFPAIGGAALGMSIPVLVLRFRAARRQRQFDAQLPELLSVWASALRAGRSFAQALDTIVDEAADPARAEFRRAQHQVRLGVPVEQALDEMSQRLGSESFELVVLTTDVQRRIGGNVAEIFDQVAETVRKRQQFAARVRALVAMGVLSARVLLAMPFVIAAILTAINHEYMSPLFTTSTGHWLIVIALVMMTLGFLVLRRMVRPRAIA